MGNDAGHVDYGFVLSDPVTKTQFNTPKVAFNVKEVRDFKHATAYVSEKYCDMTYMVVFKTPIYSFQPRVYYLDTEGTLSEAKGLHTLLNECGDDLADHIEATLKGEHNKTHTVSWHKKGRSLILKNGHVVAEYVTQNENTDHNLCLIYWEGNNKTGSIEVWYGQKIKRKEVKVFQFPTISKKFS